MHDLVTPEDVIRGIEKYRIGGRTSYLPRGVNTIHAEWKDRITK
jgi:hypothetical protein